MKPRLFKIALAALMAAAVAAPAAQAAPSTTVVIQGVAFRGPTGGNDEYIQIKNISTSPQAIGGWEIWGSNATGSAVGSRAKIAAGVTLPAGKSYLFINDQPGTPLPSAGGEYSGTVPGDQIFTQGIGDTGGLQLRNADGAVIDAVGHTGVIAAYREGTGLAFPTANGNDAFIRKAAPDTDNNANDFTGPQAFAPENCGTACVPTSSGPCKPAGTITPITSLQTMGAQSACNGDQVTVRGIVTGIDNLVGSTYDAIYKGDAGIWIQEANPDPAATTSSAVFIPGIRRAATNPEAVIGSDITITGRAGAKFGQVEIVPAGVGSTTSPCANEVNLADVATINSTGNALPAAKVLDQTAAEGQDPITRPYYRALQGMRVTLPVGIATGGGTTKFRDVFVEPGTDATRLFRKNDAAAVSTPWSDAPAELGISPDGGAGNPADPRLPWRSATQVDLDLFDVVRGVTGPLSYSFSYFKIVPQLAGATAPTIERGPINAAYPPAVPTPAAEHAARGELQRREPVPGRQVQRRAHHHAGRVRRARPHDRARGPQLPQGAGRDRGPGGRGLQRHERAHRPGRGARQLHGLHRPQQRRPRHRDRLPGQERHHRDRRRGHRRGDRQPVGQRQRVRPASGPLFDRAPYKLELKKGDLSFVAMSNHFASQSHENACRISEADWVAKQAAEFQQAGKNVLVAGDLNDFEFSTALQTLAQNNVLANLWTKAPAGLAYSYKFNGHLQTLDHIFVTAGLQSRVTDFRYVHFDNDYYERPAADGTGISDHDPPVVTFELQNGASVSQPGNLSGTVPATLALTIGNASFGAFTPALARTYDASMVATVTSTGEDAALSVIDASSTATGRLVNGTHALRSPRPDQRQRRGVRAAADRQRPALAGGLDRADQLAHRRRSRSSSRSPRTRACARAPTPRRSRSR